MMMPSIFGENLFDDFMNDFRLPAFPDVDKELYGKHAKNLMKTDVKETEKGYEVDMDLPGFKKDEIQMELNDGVLTISAAKGLDKDEEDKNGNYTYGKYGISNLSKAQEKLIDGLAEYGAEWAKADGFPEMAEEMEKRVGISKGIEKIVEPPAPKRSKGWEMEL